MNVYTMPGVADMSMVWMGAGAGPGVGSVGGGSGPMGGNGASQADLLGIGGYAPHHQDNSCDLLLDGNPHDSPSYYTTSSHHSAASNQSLDDMAHMHHSPLAPLEGLGDIHLDPHPTHHHNHHLSHPYSNDGTDDEDTSSYQENNLLQPHMMDTATQTAPCPAGGRKIKPVKHPGLVLKTPIAYERDTDPAVIPIAKDGIGTQDAIWDCGEMAEPDGFASPLQKANPCAEGSHVIYAWARDADPLKLPDDVGFQVGIGTEIAYLVLQVHYSKAFKQDQYDSSGIELLYTDQRRSKLAGVLLLATGGSIRPHSDTHMEAVCQLKENKTIHPFAYRTHTHSLAVCEKCGAIGVKHAFYTRERRFCSLACARGYSGLLPSDQIGSTASQTSNSPTSGENKHVLPSQPNYANHQFKMEYDEDYTGLVPDEPILPQLPPPPSPPSLPPTNQHTPHNQQHLHHQLFAEDLIPPLPLVRRKHTTGQLANSWDWDPDLNRNGNKFNAAHVMCFRNAPMRDEWPDIQPGMKVEVENTDCEGGGRELSVVDSFWVASVIRIVGYKALLRYEGFGQNPCKDFWVSLCSNQVHPVGWCATRGKPLIPPKTIENKFSDWKDFLRKRLTGARTLPSNYGLKVADNLRSRFKCGLQLEVVDKMRISQVKVAVVHKIVGKRLNVKYYDLPPDDAGFWCHEDSALLHPVGWAKKVGHNLVAPANYPYHHRLPHSPPSLDANYATDDLFTPIQVGVADPPCPTIAPQFAVGMKLEAIDPLNLSAICAATVMAVLRRGYIMIRIDMYEADLTGADWFCYHRTSPCIFPVGFCTTHGIPLTPPKGCSPQLFTWGTYLRETGNVPVPLGAFAQHHNAVVLHSFRESMKIEAADLMDPRLVCVGTIAKVVGRLLKVHFDGWEDEYDQWLDCDSPDIYPVGWCFSVGHKLEGPRVIPKLPNKQYLSPKGLKKRRKKKTSPNKSKETLGKSIVRISKSVGSDDPVDIMDIDEILEQHASVDYEQADMELAHQPELPHQVTQPSSPHIALDHADTDTVVTSNQATTLPTSDNAEDSASLLMRSDSVSNSPVHVGNGGGADPVNVMTVTSTSNNSNMTVTCAATATEAASIVGVDSTTTTMIGGGGGGNNNVTAVSPPPPPLPAPPVERKETSYINVSQSTSPKVIPRIIDNTGALTKQIAPDEWNVFDVAQFLRVNDCANYCDTFSKQKVDGTRLLNLNKEDILDYTGGKVGPSLKIYDLVQQLKIKINPSQSRHMKANIKKFL